MLVHQPDLLARQMTALAELCALGWVHSSGGERRCQWSLVLGTPGGIDQHLARPWAPAVMIRSISISAISVFGKERWYSSGMPACTQRALLAAQAHRQGDLVLGQREQGENLAVSPPA
jgi:hypothetical protein